MKKKTILGIAIGTLLLLVTGTALALSTPTIDWWVFGAGGGPSSGGEIVVRDTIGQPVIGPSSGGDVNLEAGYWVSGEVVVENDIHLPLVIR